MKIVSISEIAPEDWDAFCDEQDLAWYWHRTDRLRFILTRRPDSNVENRSFAVVRSKVIVAIAPLTIDFETGVDDQPTKRMTYAGTGVPLPIVDQSLPRKEREQVYASIFDEIDRIARQEGVEQLEIRWPVSHFENPGSCVNFLPRYGMTDRPQLTSVVDLRSDLDAIWANIENPHRRWIKKAEKRAQFRIVSASNVATADIEQFKSFYFGVAGKRTHSDESFALLETAVGRGLGVLAWAEVDSVAAGVVFALIYKDHAYYLMGANAAEVETPVGHFIHWELMKFLKSTGVARYELGLQQWPGSDQDGATEKDFSIAAFKRRFGGNLTPSFRAEKFYSTQRYTDTWSRRIDQACAATFSGDPVK